MTGIHVSCKKAVICKNNSSKETACLIDRKRADKNIHKYSAEHTVKYDGITVSIFGRDYIKKETEWIKHGCLNIGNEGCAGKNIGIPEWKRPVRPHVVIYKFFPLVKLENKVRTEQRFARIYNFRKKKWDRHHEKNDGKEPRHSLFVLRHHISDLSLAKVVSQRNHNFQVELFLNKKSTGVFPDSFFSDQELSCIIFC